jgi:hypothetical protein
MHGDLIYQRALSCIFLAEFKRKKYHILPGVYILKNTLPPLGEQISANVIWGEKYEKVRRKGGKCKRKRKKGKRKRKKGERK